MTVEVRRGTARFTTREQGRLTRHSFAFGPHYDPDNTGFGPLVCHDDHLLGPGVGFPEHPHAEVEIVTWVVQGVLLHEGPEGPDELRPGEVAVQSTGTGITHSEAAGETATRFVQAWLCPDQPAGTPTRSVVAAEPEPGALTTVATVGSAELAVARLGRGESVTLPDAPLQHVYVVTGALIRSSLAEPLAAGDAFRITDQPGLELTAAAPTELMVWSFSR